MKGGSRVVYAPHTLPQRIALGITLAMLMLLGSCPAVAQEVTLSGQERPGYERNDQPSTERDADRGMVDFTS